MTATVRSLYLTAPHSLTWKTDTLPEIGAQDVRLVTIAGSISIGTELPQYQGIERTAHPLTYPRMTGYESYAQVIAIGQNVERVSVGDRVFAFYGHRTHAQLHESRIYPVPEIISPTDALSTILTCDVTKGIRKLHIKPESRVLVTGGGAIGLYTLLMLQAYGMAYVDIVERLADRRKLAVDLGANHAYSPDDDIPSDYDIGIECSSRQNAFALLQTHLKQDGQICILADGNIEPLVLLPDFHAKELRVVGSSDGWDYGQHSRWFFDMIQRKQPPLDRLFDLHIQHHHLPETFARLADGSQTAIKVLVNYR